MELTPIKIPGKLKGRFKDGDNNRKSQHSKYRGNSHGRYLRLKESSSAKSKKKRDCSGSIRIISSLEKLPTELIIRIFLYCLNLDFPRSSPILTSCLSSKSVYIQTVIAVFGPTWLRWYENYKLLASTTNNDVNKENAKFQSAILRCRWASLSILLESKRIWLKKYPTPCLSKYFNPDTNNCLKRTDMFYLNPQDYLEYDFKGFTEITSLRDRIPDTSKISWETGHDVAMGVEIPSSLLSGPWSDENIKHLFWTLKAGAELNWLSSTSGETALYGLKQAISTGNIRAIYLLVWRGLQKSGIECMFHQTIDGYKLLSWALQNVGADPLAVMTHLFTLARGIISNEEKEEILAEISHLLSKAIETSDVEKLCWLRVLQPIAQKLMKSLT